MTFLGGFSGAKGGSGGSFKQRPDTLRSTDTFEGLLGLCAGPIKGLTHGLKSLKIDGTPLEDESGELNFENFLAIFADGNPASFPQKVDLRLGAGGSPVNVNLALSNTNSSGPGPWVTRTVGNLGADFLDLRIICNQLYRQDKKGIYEHTANVEIQLKPTGTVNWISPLLGTPSQSYSQSGTPTSWPGGRLYIPRNYYDTGGSYRPETNNGYFRIYGKTSSPAVHELRISVPNEGAYENVGWDIRCRLIEKESVEADPNFEKRMLTWESVSAGYNTPLGVTEPWRGLSWLQVYGKASDQLTGVPTIEGEYDTLIVPVPPSDVFNPETRTYSGAIWDGSWAQAFTTDPAWNINGLISNSTHGMASISPGAHLNKWDALEASKWFSELVPDGAGGTEPRSSLNIALNEPQKASEFVPYLAGAVGALAWEENGGEWRIKVDKPETPVDLFTLEAIQGEFSYSHTDVDTRFNDITMVFRNQEFDYREDRVRVVDSTHIARFGRKPTTIVAIGCTGRQEALRRAIMRLRVATRETRAVNFTTNRRGRMVRPLSTILIADNDLGTLLDTDENTRATGRIVSIAADRMSITVRDPLRLELGIAYALNFTVPNPDYAPDADVDPQGADVTLPTITQSVTVANTAGQRGNVTTIYLAEALPANVAPNANVALSAPELPALPKQYRITNMSIDGEMVAISAIEIDTGKWAASDSGVAEEGYVPPIDVVVPSVLNAAISAMAYDSDYRINSSLNVSWDRPAGSMIAGYRTEYRVNGSEWTVLNPRTSLTSIEMVNPELGFWEFRITTLDRLGRTSAPVVLSYTIDETLQPGFYGDGTPIDSLKPAEPGATVGAPVGTPVGDRSAEVINAQIDAAQANIDELFATYGDTASASASAVAAEQAKTEALDAAAAAEGHAQIATSKRDEAAGFASAAQAEAVTAGDAASVATSKAAAASSSESSAATSAGLSAAYRAQTAQLQGNFDFELGLENWGYSRNGTGTASLDPSDFDIGSTFGLPHLARHKNIGVPATIFNRTLIPIDPTRKYRFSCRIGAYADLPGTDPGTFSRFFVGFVGCDANGNAVDHGTHGAYRYCLLSGGDIASGNTYQNSVIVTGTGNDSWTKFPPGTVYVRMVVIMNYTANAINSYVDYVKVEDVTESEAATAQAGIATSQAAAATASAAAASSSETLSATYRNQARLTTSLALPGSFESNGDHFFEGYSGSPETRTPIGLAGAFYSVVTVSGVGKVLQTSSADANRDVANIGVLKVQAGRTYRATATFRTIANTRSVAVYLLGMDSGYNYARLAGNNGNWTATTAWQTQSVTLSGDALLAAGIVYVRAMFRGNAGSETLQVSQCRVEDVTEQVNAEAQATVATTQAAIATAEAAAAQQSASLSASFGRGYLNPNSNFADWPAANDRPASWIIWNGGAMGAGQNRRLSMAEMGRPAGHRPENSDWTYAPVITSSVNNVGMMTYPDQMPISPGRYTIEATAQLMDGSFVGAGVLVYYFDAAGNHISSVSDHIQFWADPDMAGVVSQGGFALRRWSKNIITPPNAAFIRLYAMGNYSGWTTAAKAIAFFNVGVKSGNETDATVETHSSVLATHDTKLASWLQRVAAGPGYAQIKMTALDSNGATATVIDMAADRITLGLTTVMEVVAGKVTVNGDLYVNSGKIVVDTGTHMKVIGNGFGSANQFVEWYGPKMALNLCSEANAITFIKTNGEAYYGGGFASGALRNGLGTSGLSTTQSVLLGPFGTNGNPITVAVSWIYRTEITKTYAADSSGRSIFDADVATYGATHQGSDFYSGQTTATRPSSTLQLERQIAPGALGFVTQQATTVETMSFSGTRPTLSGDPGDATTGTIIQYSAISFTYTDTAGGTGNRSFRAAINRGYTYGSGTVTQNISIVTTEA